MNFPTRPILFNHASLIIAPKGYKSCASWPDGTFDAIGNYSEDTHYTEQEAFTITKMLERMGAGGDGKAFPISTWVEPIPETPIDLSKAKPGQRLLTRHGTILTYVRPTRTGDYYDHVVRYPNGSEGTRINDGHTYRKPNKRLKADEDIIAILPELS